MVVFKGQKNQAFSTTPTVNLTYSHWLLESRKLKFSASSVYVLYIPAWASGSERNTSVFHMLGVTGSGPQFRKPEIFRKGRLDIQAHTQ